MSLHNDGTEKKNINAENFDAEVKEFIKLDGERTPVAEGEKTIHDDMDDYLFLKRKKTRSYHSRSYDDKDLYSSDSNEDNDYTIVASTKTPRGQKRKKKRVELPEDVDNAKHRYKHKKTKNSTKILKRVLLTVLCVFLAIALILCGTTAYLLYKGEKTMKPFEYTVTAPAGVTVQDSGKSVYYNGNTYVFNENTIGILCMGIDKGNLEEEGKEGTGTNGQADVLILIALDTETGKTTLINISRETMTDVAIFSALGSYVETKKQQICLSYAYGKDAEQSAENTVTSVSRLFFNIPINSYFALDLRGIGALTDSIGGVDVVSPETIAGFEEGKAYHLTGDNAEAFVRSRDESKLEANSDRMQRQQVYLDSFINTLLAQTKKNIMAPLNLFNDAKEYCSTNITPAKVTYLAQTVLKNGGMFMEKVSVPGELKMGEVSAEFYVDETSFYEMFLNIFYNKIG